MTKFSDADAKRSMDIADKIVPMLRGTGPLIQGAVLAQLVATWLHGHHGETAKQSQQLRLEIFKRFVTAVCNLVDVEDMKPTKH